MFRRFSQVFVTLFLLLLTLIFLSCVSSGSSNSKKSINISKTTPAWVNDVYSSYDKARYVAATGFAGSREQAEGNALAALTSFFGQTVEVDRNAVSFFRQAVVNNVINEWIDTDEMRTNIKTTASMDNLMGAEIEEVWYDSKEIYYAVAVMEKQRAIRIYSDLLKANLNIIKNLVAMTPNERNSMEGVIRYRFAASVADINVSYKNIITLLNGTVTENIVSGDSYRLEAQNIIKIIPINIRISNDRNGRIFGAFAKTFTDWGFEAQTGTTNARYILDVNITLSPVDLPANPNIFARIELAANFTDTRANLVLIPYTFNSREGHTNRAEAENRCIMVAERSVNEEFASLLSAYLSRLMPKK
ncbi:MAG: LPP20 family lipoprotein [Treponema sp.]|nr:LPP20 family lipoprotein [Treponema sp.]MCL2250685.1 LPP20 family lipoprotein [Treponema sp.]